LANCRDRAHIRVLVLRPGGYDARETRPGLFALRLLPPITLGVIETFDTVIGTYDTDRQFQ